MTAQILLDKSTLSSIYTCLLYFWVVVVDIVDVVDGVVVVIGTVVNRILAKHVYTMIY